MSLLNWIDERIPLTKTYKKHIKTFKNLKKPLKTYEKTSTTH